MEQRRRVTVVPVGQPIQTGALLIIEENETLDSFLLRASDELWENEKIGKTLFFFTGVRIRRNLNAILSGDTLYISEDDHWIGNTSFLESN
jgi:hypothetical protein